MEALQNCSEFSMLFVRGDRRKYVPATSSEIVEAALQIVSQEIREGDALTSPQLAHYFARLKLTTLEHEVFAVFLLDAQNRLIEYVELFRGSVTACPVYPREVVKLARSHNAASLILVHNHPSGSPEPSQADRQITERLRSALALIEVQVVDHLIVGGSNVLSFAERGLL
jgi:DNA repair protein RadC